MSDTPLAKAKALHAKYGGHGSFHVRKDGDDYSAHLTTMGDDDGCAVVVKSSHDSCDVRLNKEVTSNFDQDELKKLFEKNAPVEKPKKRSYKKKAAEDVVEEVVENEEE